MTMPAIRLTNVSKKYFLEYRQRASLKDFFIKLCRGNLNKKEFWALKDINLEVPRGRVLGIIGKNGSGKTTLLKLLSGVTKPTEGSIRRNGRVAGLLELGAGFQGDLTGRENIYLNGSILGVSMREIRENLDFIIEFADIGDFIDAPIRTYSAGMYLRLGFAVAMQFEPDILLIDEVLAVGDIGFQKKCLEKIKEFKRKNKTIIFVSHSLRAIQELCERVILLNEGVIYKEGFTLDAIKAYQNLMGGMSDHLWLSADGRKEAQWKWGERKVEIKNVYFLDNNSNLRDIFRTGEKMVIRIEYFAPQKVENPVFGLAIHREDGIHITGPNTKFSGYKIDFIERKGCVDFIIDNLTILPGTYEVTASVHTYDQTILYDSCERLFRFKIIQGDIKDRYGLVFIPHIWKMVR